MRLVGSTCECPAEDEVLVRNQLLWSDGLGNIELRRIEGRQLCHELIFGPEISSGACCSE
jgi:hypothetical protein